ncbi:hypothetical protein [Mesorhizobium erdmanii]|uniref:DUF4304 domain-containing protein n=1 Tax=Mesorhizobium erdmanii TaxID=1777866 RepID=A0A6M7UK41_9HYPH|nr:MULTISPECIES: hypothetical protein [Mesorhizobium]OBQ73318.1 hypothetical protein A8146_24640 [Mesorhizobium loti]QKC76490.1 hypothetical protein EB233_13945 [Mesorhizobium erdmanii]
MVLNAKTIRVRVAEALHAHLGERWFKPSSAKLLIESTDLLTDFSIELDCSADYRYGAYDCELAAAFKWKKFAKLWKDFDAWYEVKDPSSAQFKTSSSRQRNKQFLLKGFNAIDGDFQPSSRGFFWVGSEQDLDAFVIQCIADLDGNVGAWIRRWFTWESALDVMDGNSQLCGSWRDTAYFCLLEQVHGREAACKWISGIDATGWPALLAAQVEYLQSQVCSGMSEGKAVA